MGTRFDRFLQSERHIALLFFQDLHDSGSVLKDEDACCGMHPSPAPAHGPPVHFVSECLPESATVNSHRRSGFSVFHSDWEDNRYAPPQHAGFRSPAPVHMPVELNHSYHCEETSLHRLWALPSPPVAAHDLLDCNIDAVDFNITVCEDHNVFLTINHSCCHKICMVRCHFNLHRRCHDFELFC